MLHVMWSSHLARLRDSCRGRAFSTRGFPPGELLARFHEAQRRMEEEKLDSLLITTEADFSYFSGFVSQFWASPTRPMLLLLPREGPTPIALVPDISLVPMQTHCPWISDIRSWPSPRPEDDGRSMLLDAVLESIPHRHGRMGMPMGHETSLRMPLTDLLTVKEEMGLWGGLSLVDAAPLVQSMRVVKSPAEIDKLRTVCGIASRAFAALPGHLQARITNVPLTQRDVVRQFQHLLLEQGADSVPYCIGTSGRGGYSSVVDGPSDKALRGGDLFVIDTGARWDNYFCDFDRNFVIAGGEAAPEVLRAHEQLWRATESGFQALQPGAHISDVWRAMAESLQRESGVGLEVLRAGRMGHGLGMQLTEFPSIVEGEDLELKAGMVLTLEPALPLPDGKLLVHEENVVVTEGGAEFLTERADLALPVLPACVA